MTRPWNPKRKPRALAARPRPEQASTRTTRHQSRGSHIVSQKGKSRVGLRLFSFEIRDCRNKRWRILECGSKANQEKEPQPSVWAAALSCATSADPDVAPLPSPGRPDASGNRATRKAEATPDGGATEAEATPADGAPKGEAIPDEWTPDREAIPCKVVAGHEAIVERGSVVVERGPIIERCSVAHLCACRSHRDRSRAEDPDRGERDDRFSDHVLAPWIQALLFNAVHVALSARNNRIDGCSCGTLKFNNKSGSLISCQRFVARPRRAKKRWAFKAKWSERP